MSKFKDFFGDLVKSVLGGIPVQDKSVSDALDSINNRLTKTSYTNMFEMLANMKNKNEYLNQQSKNPKDSSYMDLINVGGDYEDEIYDLFMRRQKYRAYTDMIKKISRLGRAVKVTRSNIISSDSIKNSGLVFKSMDEDNENQVEVERGKEIFKMLKLNNHKALRTIIDASLKYGDYFIELAVAKNLFPDENKMHMESDGSESQHGPLTKEFKFDGETLMSVSLETNTSKTQILESENDNDIVLDDILIIKHKPHNVIKLTLGDTIYGYLIIPENIIKTRLMFQNINLFDSAEKMIDMTKSLGMDYVYAQKTIERSVDITKNILAFLKNNINKEAIDNNDGLKSVVTKLVFSSLYSVGSIDKMGSSLMDKIDTISIGNIPFRFVDVAKMQEFAINVDEYDPYGTSMFDNIIFDAKLLVADKITSSIDRITKSTERRIVNFEVDNRNSAAMIQKLKEKFRKKKALFSGDGSFDNIPSLITPFEEYYIPKHNGVPFVDFTTEPPTSNHQAASDDMKFKRDEIVGDINIPPAYLGLEENIESKATLFLQNILFAIEIMDHQEVYSTCFTDLLDKINNMVGHDAGIGTVKVGFAIPVILNSASELEHISNVSGVKDFLKSMGVSPDDVRKRYMPFLNSYFSDRARTSSNIEKLSHGEEGEDDEGGAPGGF